MNENSTVQPEVMIVLVNWNRYRDTLACLDSLRKMDYPNFFVVVCDNGSQDDSVERFRMWAEEQNVAYRKFSAEELAQISLDKPQCGSLTCLAGVVNRGFAAANNWALQYALRLRSVQYVWLLNNDTVVDTAALRELVHAAGQDSSVGMCGSTVLRMDRPDTVQCMGGGRYDYWTGRTRHIGDGSRWFPPADDETSHLRSQSGMDFVYGASMLVSCPFLRDIGLMSEDYFLYFEELDWAQRARGRYSLGYAPRSVIWHKEGASIS